MWIPLYVLPVPPKHAEKEFVLRVPDGLDDEAVISREVEEGSTLPWGGKFGEDVLGSKG